MAIRSIRSAKLSVTVACAMTLASSSFGQEWSNLKGRIVVTGDVPKPSALEITRDEEVCGVFGLTDESLLVNAKNNGLKNVVVWLSSKKPVPVHPDFMQPPKPV